ncbi:MAG TPA: hypothetical protein VI795_03870 [Patescibacteria group bacterium]|nr:hypothetical protein [Patescibacteria group bacterium]
MNIIKRFKSLPISSRRLLSLGIIFGLVVALPLFVWSIVNLTFNLREKAATGEPVPVPINWTTSSVSITASDFRVTTNNDIFTGASDEVTIIPGVLTQDSTSIQINSNSSPNFSTSLKMVIDFRSSGSVWWVEKIKVLNSEYKNDWVEFNGPYIYTALGHPYTMNLSTSFSLKDPSNGQLIAVVDFTNLKVHGFTGSTPPPTACPPYPLNPVVVDDRKEGILNQTIKYDLDITHNDPNCLGTVKVTLTAHGSSGWPIVFTNNNFYIEPNATYHTSFYVTATSGQGEMPITISAETVYPENSATKTVIFKIISPTEEPTTPPIGGGEPNSCGGTCGSNYNCKANLFCYQGFCRNPICASNSDCNCATATATATAKTTAKSTINPKKTSTSSPKGGNVTSSPSYTALPTLSSKATELPEEEVTTEPENKFFTKYALPIFAVFLLIVVSTIYFAVKKNKEKPNIPNITPPVNI